MMRVKTRLKPTRKNYATHRHSSLLQHIGKRHDRRVLHLIIHHYLVTDLIEVLHVGTDSDWPWRLHSRPHQDY